MTDLVRQASLGLQRKRNVRRSEKEADAAVQCLQEQAAAGVLVEGAADETLAHFRVSPA